MLTYYCILKDMKYLFSPSLCMCVGFLQEEKRQQPICEPEAHEHHEKPDETEQNPRPPLIPAKMRKSCGLTDLLGQTYGDVGAPPKSLSATAEEEVKRYQEVTSLALTEDPLSWWKSHEEVYPFLATLAKRYSGAK